MNLSGSLNQINILSHEFNLNCFKPEVITMLMIMLIIKVNRKTLSVFAINKIKTY